MIEQPLPFEVPEVVVSASGAKTSEGDGRTAADIEAELEEARRAEEDPECR